MPTKRNKDNGIKQIKKDIDDLKLEFQALKAMAFSGQLVCPMRFPMGMHGFCPRRADFFQREKQEIRYGDQHETGMRMYWDEYGKMGLVDKNRKIVIGAGKYQSLEFWGKKFILAFDGHKFGILDLTGRITTPFKYDTIKIVIQNNYTSVRKSTDGDAGIIDMRNGNVLVPLKYDSIWYLEKEGLLCFGGKKDQVSLFLMPSDLLRLTEMKPDTRAIFVLQSTINIPREWKDKYGKIIPLYKCQSFLVQLENKKYNLIDKRGKQIAEFDFDIYDGVKCIGDWERRTFIYHVDYKYGLMNFNGVSEIRREYEGIKTGIMGMCAAKFQGKWALIHLNDAKTPFIFDDIWYHDEKGNEAIRMKINGNEKHFTSLQKLTDYISNWKKMF